MTRQEFILEAKQRGKSKEETRLKYDELDVAGRFDDSESVVEPVAITPEPVQEPKPPTFEQRVQSDADRLAMESLGSQQRDPGGINKVLAPVRQFTGTAAAHFNQSLPYRMVGKGVEKVLGAAPEPLKEAGAGAARKLGGLYSKLPEPVKNTAGILGDVASIVPGVDAGVMVGGKVASTGAKVLGEGLEKSGKKLLRSEMKPRDTTALLAGKNVEEGAKRIVDNISKYGVESPGKGFEGVSGKAAQKIRENMDASDAAITKAAQANPNATVDIDGSLLNLMDDLQTGKIDSVFGDEARAAELVSDIHKALDLRGLSGVQSIEKIPEIKRTIAQYGGGLFKKGKYAIETDPIKKQVGELAYLKLKTDLEGIVPEIKQYNTATHDLITIKTAADQASKRIGNKNEISLQDWMILLGGPAAAHSLGLPSAAAGAIPGSIMVGRKVLGSGRGASGMISAGKGIQKVQKLGETDVSDLIEKPVDQIRNTIGNERGAIGVGGSMGMGDNLLPAIKDPLTGKIYVGNRLYGHKFVSGKGETTEVKDRLSKEYFKDNINAGKTETVGFVDEKGNFVSRQEAESIYAKPRSLAQIYHDEGKTNLKILGGTAGIAAGGIYANEKLKRKDKK